MSKLGGVSECGRARPKRAVREERERERVSMRGLSVGCNATAEPNRCFELGLRTGGVLLDSPPCRGETKAVRAAPRTVCHRTDSCCAWPPGCPGPPDPKCPLFLSAPPPACSRRASACTGSLPRTCTAAATAPATGQAMRPGGASSEGRGQHRPTRSAWT
jgi:hypothetical protein